jgi:hypothetical protein
MKRLLTSLVGLISAGVISATPAVADMCGPANGPLGYLYPTVQNCLQPGIGMFPNVPTVSPAQTVPYPVRLPTPFYPFPTQPLP